MALFSKPHKIVIVDDDPFILDFIGELLVYKYKKEIDISLFTESVKAFEYIKANEIALVISDMKMPGQHGSLFLNACKNLQKGIKTIAITGHPSISNTITRYRDGDLGILIKPFSENDLFELIDFAFASINRWNKTIKNMVS